MLRWRAFKVVGSCVVLTFALVVMVACGSSSSSSGGTTPPAQVSIQLNQSAVTLAPTQTSQFSATVTGSSNTAVTWFVDTVSGGNSTVGTIDSSGLYTAPAQGGSHTVMAASVADPTKTATAAVTVSAPVISVGISPLSASLLTTATQQFTATVQNSSNTAVTWSVDQISGGNSTVGTVSASGLYTAPTVPGAHSVVATSVADPTKSAAAAVTVTASMVSVTPNPVALTPGTTQQFTATVQSVSNPVVIWSVDQVSGGNSTVGTISASGLYTAPATTGSHTITATYSGSSGSAQVSVFTLALSPTSTNVVESTTQQFTATVQGLSGAVLDWSVDQVSGGNATVGTITSTGLYSAPATIGNHTVSVTVANTTAAASAAVSVFVFSVSPATSTLAPSATQQFTATIQGLTNTSVTWSVDNVAGGNSTTGTISSSGLYTAPFAIGPHTITATSAGSPSNSVSAALTVINSSPAAVLTYHNDDTRDGAYTQETTLTPSNVNSAQFGKLLAYPVDGQIYAQPLYLPNVNIPNVGTRDVVYVVTQNNSVYAFDAEATAATPTTFWQVNLGPSVMKDDAGGVWPNVGILSTPVIDATTNTIYLVVESSVVNGATFFLHALDVTTGAEKPNSPVGVTATYGGDTMELMCYQRMGLALDPVTNWIYLPFGSCTHGWVLAYDKTALTQEAVIEDTNGAAGGGLWAGGGAPAIDDVTGDLYLMSGTDAGDEQYITGSTQVGYNDSFLRLKATDLSVLDYFSPDDNYTLAQNDADLGSGSNILVPGSSTYPNETLGGGKDGMVYVVNRDKMGGFNDGVNDVLQTLQTGVRQYNNIFSTPVYWNGSIYYHSNGDVLKAYSWTAGAAAGQQLSTQPTSSGSTAFQLHGATPSLSANGNLNGIVWETDNSLYNSTDPTASGPLVLHAYNATNLTTELYNSNQAGSRDTAGLALKFTVPTIANGRVFVPTATELDIYGLLGP